MIESFCTKFNFLFPINSFHMESPVIMLFQFLGLLVFLSACSTLTKQFVQFCFVDYFVGCTSMWHRSLVVIIFRFAKLSMKTNNNKYMIWYICIYIYAIRNILVHATLYYTYICGATVPTACDATKQKNVANILLFSTDIIDLI